MPGLSSRKAVLMVGLAAGLVYAGTLGNEWALDDHPVIERNAAAHSVAAALDAAFSPYWPPERDLSAGLYRPFTVLTFALDWAVSGGRPWWFHLVNVLLHAGSSALVVLVAGRWLPPLGAGVAGLAFALHPVHVEAVANVVGRAEMLAAMGLLLAVLAARRYRHDPHSGTWRWLAATAGAVAVAQFSKEHAVVAIALLGLDHLLDPEPARRPTAGLYVAVAAVTLAFLQLWVAVSGDLVASAAVVPLAGRAAGQRLAAVLPVQLEVLRLLVWPWDLVAEYGPQTVPVRYVWTPIAFLGALVSAAVLALAVAVRRRVPAVAFGLLAAAVSYAPTSNLFFVSGVMLAERALYLAALAPALVLGWVACAARPQWSRRAVTGAGLLLMVGFCARTVTRVPFWRDTRTVVIEGFIQHPESFAAHVRLAQVREQTGDVQGAVAQYLAALAVYDGYSFVAVRAARLALSSGRATLAAELARFARERDPHHPLVARLQADVHLRAGLPDSAVEATRQAVEARPGSITALEEYVDVLRAAGVAAWRRHLASARLEWRRGRAGSASSHLDSAAARLPSVPAASGDCWEVRATATLAETLRPETAAADLKSLEQSWIQLYAMCRVTDTLLSVSSTSTWIAK